MTNRDPNTTEFIKLVNEYYSCIEKYWKISRVEKLLSDQNRSDTDLVCFYELKSLRDHALKSKLQVPDFMKMNHLDEQEFNNRIKKANSELHVFKN
jgi:hypothetical protein